MAVPSPFGGRGGDSQPRGSGSGWDQGYLRGFFHIICPRRALGANEVPGQTQAGQSPQVVLMSLAAKSHSLHCPCSPAPRSPTSSCLEHPGHLSLPGRCAITSSWPELPHTGPGLSVGLMPAVPTHPHGVPLPNAAAAGAPDAGVSLLPQPCPCSLWSLQRVTRNSPGLVSGGSWRAGP